MPAPSSPHFKTPFVVALGAALATSILGCDLNKIAANQTSGLLEAASPALDAFFDYETAGTGTPAVIMQLEAFHYLSPDNEGLAITLAKAYMGYGLGWVENEKEAAEDAGDLDRAEQLQLRARGLYLRGRDLGLRVLNNRDEGFDAAVKAGDEEGLRAYLAEHYEDKEDAVPLLWTGACWGGAIAMSMDDPDLIADLWAVKLVLQRSVDLDQGLMNATAYTFLAGLEAAIPATLGGNPDKAKKMFEEALSITKRRNHMVHLAYAKLYAVNTANRELYVSLLEEILESDDLGDDVRLNNKIAHAYASRYMKTVDNLF